MIDFVASQAEKKVLEKILSNPEKFTNEKPLKIYTTEEIAEKLRTSDTTVRNLCNSGKMAHLRSGRNITVTEEQLQQFIQKHTKNGQ